MTDTDRRMLLAAAGLATAGPTLADASAVIVDSTAAPALATGTAQPASTPARSGERARLISGRHILTCRTRRAITCRTF